MRKITTFLALCLAIFALNAQEKWSATGDFTYGVESWQAQIVAYDDDSFTIQNWFGQEGYDLSFTINDDGTLHFIDCEYLNEYAIIPASASREIGMFQDALSAFYGTANSGYITMQAEYQENIRFQWPATLWTVTGNMELINEEDNFSDFYDCVLSANIDGSFSLSNWYGQEGYSLDFSVNEDATINILNGYTIGTGTDDTTTVTGGEVSQVKLYQNSQSSFIGQQAKGELTFRSVDSQLFKFTWPVAIEGARFRVNGILEYPLNDELKQKSVEMISWDNGEYTLVSWYSQGFDLSFTVNEDGTLHFIGGSKLAEFQVIPYAPDPNAGFDYNGSFYQDARSGFEMAEDGSGKLWFTEYEMCFSLQTFEYTPITYEWDSPEYIDDSVSDLFFDARPLKASELKIYDISGRVVSPENLDKGIFIISTPEKTFKIAR